jgi:superfamily I DNA and RNA helicase
VFFPDIGDANALSRPDLPGALIGCAKDLRDPRAWIERVFAFWSNDAAGYSPIGRRGVEVVRDVFARSFVVAPLVASQLAEQEARRLVLTKDQMRVLDFLRSRRRVAVSGGAGTGKTVLALEKARRLASEGFRTLLTCYNRQLADHLSHLCAGTVNLEVMSFHQLCHRQVDRANRASGRDLVGEAKVTYPGKDLYEVQLPNALAYSLEVLPDRYDAIVCDEGQDFRDEFWVPLELLLSDYDRGPLYVFYDDNQNLYARAGTFPIRDEPFTLTTNCRNTAPIHEAAYKHYKGVPVTPPDIQGDDVQFDEAPGRDAQAAKINARIVDLVARHGVAAGDIAVLVADAMRKAEYYAALRRLPLPRPAVWLEEGVRGENTVLIDTIQRFKGLESPVVILWGLDSIDLARFRELLYVGKSRAKSLLVLVATSETRRMLQATTGR